MPRQIVFGNRPAHPGPPTSHWGHSLQRCWCMEPVLVRSRPAKQLLSKDNDRQQESRRVSIGRRARRGAYRLGNTRKRPIAPASEPLRHVRYFANMNEQAKACRRRAAKCGRAALQGPISAASVSY